MKKVVIIMVIGFILSSPIGVEAQRGCCSHHGGVASCDPSGKYRCQDGTLSPSCTCSGGGYSPSTYRTPSSIYGCTNPKATNYNAKATKDDGSCLIQIEGCMDPNSINYNKSANTEDGSCKYENSIKETESIKFQKEYKKTRNLKSGEEKITEKGELGTKEITYKIITDKDGNVISKEQVEEMTTKESKNEIILQGTKDTPSPIIGILWIIAIIIVLTYKSKNKNASLLINKINNQPGAVERLLLYFFYFIFIIPVMIDIILVIIDIKKRSNVYF